MTDAAGAAGAVAAVVGMVDVADGDSLGAATSEWSDTHMLMPLSLV